VGLQVCSVGATLRHRIPSYEGWYSRTTDYVRSATSCFRIRHDRPPDTSDRQLEPPLLQRPRASKTEVHARRRTFAISVRSVQCVASCVRASGF
jgi:hypothetical protein